MPDRRPTRIRRLAAGALLASAVGAAAQPPAEVPSPDAGKSREQILRELAVRYPVPVAPPAAPPVRGVAVAVGPAVPLGLEEVLTSVDGAYPLLQIQFLERGVLDGRLLAGLGQFDTNLRAGTVNVPYGSYENFRTDFSASQRFVDTGASLTGGFRTGYGQFPLYNGGLKTADGGEFRGGVSIPLLRDRAIDRGRATIRQAALEREGVEPAIETQRLTFQRTAARVYWAWVAAGRQLAVVNRVLQLARDRDTQLRELRAAGRVADIAVSDNLQAYYQRSVAAVQAERAFQRAQVELSLFLRDPAGEPLVAGADRLPAAFPPLPEPDPTQFDAAVQMAFAQRPELRRLRFQREVLLVQRQLALNQALPGVNFNLSGSQDLGAGKPKDGPNRLDRFNITAELGVDVPWQRRQALGDLRTADARLAQLAFQEKFQADTIRAELQDAFARLERSYVLRTEAGRRVAYSREVAAQERGDFAENGRGTILQVTLREIAVVDAEVTELVANLEFFTAMSDYRAALGFGADLPGPPPAPRR